MVQKSHRKSPVVELFSLKNPSFRIWLTIASAMLLMFVSGMLEANTLSTGPLSSTAAFSTDATNGKTSIYPKVGAIIGTDDLDLSGTALSIVYSADKSTVEATICKVQLKDKYDNPIGHADVTVAFEIPNGLDIKFPNGSGVYTTTTNAEGTATVLVNGKLAKTDLKAYYDHDLDFETPMFTALDDFRISDMGTDGNADFDVAAVDIAYNSTDNEYLVVWSGDDNSGSLVDGELEIFGQRLDGNGNEIGTDFRISDMGPDGNAAYDALDPRIAYNSTDNEYLVVWSGDDNSGSLVDDENEIFGQRLSAAGVEIGTDFRISDMGPDGDAAYDAVTPALAYNSTNNLFIVVWSGDDNTGSLVDGELETYRSRISATGAILDFDLRISDMGPDGNTTYRAVFPDIVYNTNDNVFMVAWNGSDDLPGLDSSEEEIYVQRLSGQLGVEIGTNDQRVSDLGDDGNNVFDATRPSVAHNTTDNEYLVTWQGEDNVNGLVQNENEIFGQRINFLGVEVGDNDFRISNAGPDANTTYAALGAAVVYSESSNEYLVIWFGDDDTGTLVNGEFEVFGQRLNASGTKVGDTGFRISNMGPDGNTSFAALEPELVWNSVNNEYMVTWFGDDNTGSFVDNEFEVYIQNQAFPPLLVSSTPADNATGVSQTDNLTLTFNENIVLGTSGTIQIIDTDDGSGSFSIDVASHGGQLSIVDNVLTINPGADLDGATNYAIQISASAIESSLSGVTYEGISDNTTLNFTTVGDVSDPVLVSSNPADDDTEVPVADNLTFTFNENVVFGTGNITITDITAGSTFLVIDAANPGASGASISGNILTIDPSSSLLNNNQYSIRFESTAIDDASGNSYAGISDNTTLNFFTFTTSPGGVDTNLRFWVKADKGVDSGGDNTDITRWNGQTINFDDLFPLASAPNYISSSDHVNFNPYIDFERTTSDMLNGPNFGLTGSATYQLFFVYNETSAPSLDANLWDWDGTQGDESIILFTERFINAAGGTLPTVTAGRNEWHIGVANTSSNATVRLSGEESSVTGTRDASVQGNGSIVMGIKGELDANIAEVIYYNTALNTGTDLQQIESYLGLKYGITLSSDSDGDGMAFEAGEGDYLDSNGNVIWDASVNSTYHHNVAGIIRDDRSDIIQRQSRSVNSGAIVTIGLDDDTDGLEGTNADNPSSFSADRSALIWGHDNADLNGGEGSAAETEFDPLQVKSRLNREWKVGETGTLGTVTIQFDVSGLLGPDNTIGTSDENQIVLLVDADGNFSSGASVVSQSFVTPADGLVLFRVDLSDGMFFTLGSGEQGALPIMLLSFNAASRGKNVLIQWETASEENNQFFSIERSVDGQTFESIALLDGAGNSEVNRAYQYIDHKPLRGNSFYRLVDIDHNGNHNYSEVRSVSFSTPVIPLIGYPNPISGDNILRIKGGDNERHDVRILVSSLLGELVLDQRKTSVKYSDLKIDAQKWPSGIYMLRVFVNEQLMAKPIKIIK